jgi:3-dehydroquinate synthase
MENIIYSTEGLKKIICNYVPSKIILVSSSFLILKLNWVVKELDRIADGKITIINIPDGEKAKEWAILEKLLKKFSKAGLDRKSIVIALGGGSVTDLVGFAASIYQRGVPYINMPTTLLGQVDASIGGKTAINFQGYKNQIGSFHNPIATIIDTRFLKTIKKKQIIDGLAEIIKAGLIKDKSILKIIESHDLLELVKSPIVEKLIKKSINVKEYFVDKDPRDNDVRQILNFGHTVGHSLELKYNLSHGRAVLIGIIKELEIAEKLKETKPDIRIYLNNIFKNLNISSTTNNFLEIDHRIILYDKKNLDGYITLPIVKRVGDAELIKISLKRLILLCDSFDR